MEILKMVTYIVWIVVGLMSIAGGCLSFVWMKKLYGPMFNSMDEMFKEDENEAE